jgi:hypothetical protein
VNHAAAPDNTAHRQPRTRGSDRHLEGVITKVIAGTCNHQQSGTTSSACGSNARPATAGTTSQRVRCSWTNRSVAGPGRLQNLTQCRRIQSCRATDASSSYSRWPTTWRMPQCVMNCPVNFVPTKLDLAFNSGILDEVRYPSDHHRDSKHHAVTFFSGAVPTHFPS